MQRGSMIFCTQFDVPGWYKRINPDPNNDSPIKTDLVVISQHLSPPSLSSFFHFFNKKAGPASAKLDFFSGLDI